jgi:hypothetical protein
MLETEYHQLVQHVTTIGLRIPLVLVADYQDPLCRSMLGRYLARIEKDYTKAMRVLETVIDCPVNEWTEDIVWCKYDYTVCQYHLTGDAIGALRALALITKWIKHQSDPIQLLPVNEILKFKKTLQIIHSHKKRKEKMICLKKIDAMLR